MQDLGPKPDMSDECLSRGFGISRDQIFLSRARNRGHDVENTQEW